MPTSLLAQFSSRCPRCGKGKLFAGFIDVAPACTACGLSYKKFDSGDGPAIFIILIAGFVVVGLALWTEVNFEPPYWVHAILWLPLILIVTLGLLRPLKSWMIHQQYRHKAEEARHDDIEPGA